MLVIFVLYTTSITLFTHVHVVGGVSVVHSHFYDFWDDNTSEVGILKIIINCFTTSDIEGAKYPTATATAVNKDTSASDAVMADIPSKEHRHSSDQLILFEMLSHLKKVGLPLLLFFIVPVIVFIRPEIVNYIRCYVVRPFLKSYSLRGPPAFLLS